MFHERSAAKVTDFSISKQRHDKAIYIAGLVLMLFTLSGSPLIVAVLPLPSTSKQEEKSDQIAIVLTSTATSGKYKMQPHCAVFYIADYSKQTEEKIACLRMKE